jgi:hypothetical protein
MHNSVMLERRRLTRTRALTAAKIIASPHSRLYDCLVRDISTFGAGLEILGAVTLPGIFELTFDSARTLRVCRLIWRDSECMGVQFSAPKPVVDLLNSHRLPPPDRFVLQHSRNYKS